MTDTRDTDRALVARLLNGREEAFAEFFELMFPRVYRFALARLGEREDAAEDVAQVTLCQVVRRLETWRGEGGLLPRGWTLCPPQIEAGRGRDPGVGVGRLAQGA